MAGKRFRSSLAQYSPTGSTPNADVYVERLFEVGGSRQLPAPTTDFSGITNIANNTTSGETNELVVTGIVNLTGVVVIENQNITIGNAALINAQTNGSHIYFVNCDIEMWDTGTSNGRVKLSATTSPSSNSFTVGNRSSTRADSISFSSGESASKGVHYYGCNVRAYGSARANFILLASQAEDCVFEWAGSGAGGGAGMQVYPSSGDVAFLRNDFVKPNDLGLMRVLFALTGNGGFEGNTFVRASPGQILGGNLVLNGFTRPDIDTAAAVAPEYYRINGSSTVLSIDSAPRMSTSHAGQEDAIEDRNGPLFEASSLNARFVDATGNPVSGVNARILSNANFSAGFPTNVLNTSPAARTFVSDANGYLSGNYNYITGASGTFTATEDTFITFPTFRVRSTTDLTDYTNSLDIRSFKNFISSSGSQAISITAATERARGIGANTPITLGASTYPLDTSISATALAAADLNAYFYGAGGRFDTNVSVQDIADALKYNHSIYDTNAVNRSTSGSIATFDHGVFLDTTSQPSPVIAGNGDTTFGGVTGLLAPRSTDVITQLNLVNQDGILQDLEYNGGVTIPEGYVFGRARHINFSNNLVNVTVVPNNQLRFVGGDTYSISQSDFTGVNPATDFGHSGTGVVNITSPQGDTSFSTAQRAAINARTDFTFTEVAPLITRTVRPAGTIEEIRQAGGRFGYRQQGADFTSTDTSLVNVVNIGPTTTLDDVTLSRTTAETQSYNVYYLPESTNSTIFDYTQLLWNPVTSESSVMLGFQPDPAGVVTGGIPALTTVAITPDANLDAGGVANFAITTWPSSPTVGHSQALAINVINTELYFRAIINGVRDASSRLITFGGNSTTSYTGDLIRFSSATAIQLPAASGFLFTTATVPSPTVGSASVINAQASTSQIESVFINFYTNNVIGRAIRRALGFLVGRRLGNKSAPNGGYQNDGSQDTNYLNNL